MQVMVSTESGRLGEWFEPDGAAPDESRPAGGSLAGSSVLRREVRRVWVITVEEIK